MFTSNIRKGVKCDLSDFDCGMVVDARWPALSILKWLVSWDFHTQQSCDFLLRNGQNKIKIQQGAVLQIETSY